MPGATIFADINKIVTMFIKIIFKDSINWKLCIKMESISVFLDIAKFADFQ